MVELCQQAGLVWGAELFFDGTKVRANADIDSLVPRWYAAARAHLDGLFASEGAPADPPDEEGAAGFTVPDASVTVLPPSVPLPTRLPFSGTPEAERDLAAANASVWKLLATQRLDPDRPPSGP